MKNVVGFLKTTILGGLFVLLPLFLLYFMLAEIVGLVIALASPIIELLPPKAFDQQHERVLFAMFIIIIASFLIGLFSRSAFGRRLGHWLEDSTLSHIPTYDVFKKLTQGFADLSDNTFKPALFESLNGVQDLVYLVEDNGKDRVTILMPSAPTAFTGPVKIVDRNRVIPLDVNLANYTAILGRWGVGSSKLKAKETHARLQGKHGSIECPYNHGKRT
jgi:uncharacterized membrane protein